MQRWYNDRIGGMFTANAEALADIALAKPSVGIAEIGFTSQLCDMPVLPSKVVINKQSLSGWAKTQDRKSMGMQVFLGTLATMLGAPSAPYIYVRGIDQIFSPACIERPHQMPTENPYHRISAEGLGAAGQFRVWINDTDGLHNMARNCNGAFYIYDHDAHPDYEEAISPKNGEFIQKAMAAVCELNGAGEAAYMSGAAEMARRITTVSKVQLETMADNVRKENNLSIDRDFVGSLIKRMDLMQKPQLAAPSMPVYHPQPFILQLES